MLVESLLKNAADSPADLAVVDDHGNHTFADLAALTLTIAHALPKLPEPKTVGILLPPGARGVAAFHGTLLSGNVVVPINYLLSVREIIHVIADAKVRVILTTQLMIDKLAELLPGAADALKQATSAGIKIIDVSTLPPNPAPITPPRVGPDDTAVIMYTSGTSSLPKGAILSYGNLESDVDAAIAHIGFARNHVFLGLIPLFHSFGMTAMMLVPARLAARAVYLARFSPAGALQAIREHGASIFLGVPSMFAAIGRLKNASADDFRGMYVMASGGEPLPNAVRELFLTRFKISICEGYGLTETSPILSFNTPVDNEPGSVGRPIPGCVMRIAPDADGPPNAAGEGEIQVKGPMIFHGYYNNPAATRDAFTDDGFFRTGDLGKVDARGFLHITGRLKDLIISSGEKCHPREVEEILATHPSVAEVAVIGRKDATRGEVPVAFVVPHEGQAVDAQALKNFARDRGLAQWKIPRDIYPSTSLPRSPTGKVLKRELGKLLPAE
jgi:long-chain acyl-CoA synthetase